MPDLDINLLVLIDVSQSQSKKLMSKLNKQHFFFTVIDSRNSLFHEPSVFLLLGLNQSRMVTLNQLVQKYCQPYRKFIPVQLRATSELSVFPVLEAQEGGATLYGIPVEYFEQI